MAGPFYVDATTPGDGTDGLTWAKAEVTLAAGVADSAAGERVWVEDGHVESTAGAVTITMPGTLASPTQILCGDKAAEPPTALATGAQVITTAGSSQITVNGHGYVYGIIFSAGSGANNVNLALNNTTASHKQTYEQCDFILGTTGAGSTILLGNSSTVTSTECNLIDCDFKFGAVGQAISCGGRVTIRGGIALAGGSSPTNVFEPLTGEPLDLLVDGFDFTNWGSSYNLFLGGAFTQSGRAVFRNCKLHSSSWTGLLVSTAITLPGCRFELRNCAAGDTNYALWIEDYAGSIRHETTLIKTGGASDGTTGIAWKMASSGNAEYPHQVLYSPEIQKWNETTGSAVTITVDILRDSATNLQDDEVWLEVEYLGTSGFPLASFVDDAKADIVASAADQATSAATWTTTGMSNPNEQKLSVTFTPQEKGLIIARVVVAEPSITVYVDPELQVS